MELILERNVTVQGRAGAKTHDEVFVLSGTSYAQRDVPKQAGLWWDSERKRWWTPDEDKARQFAQYARNGLRERWGIQPGETSPAATMAAGLPNGAVVGTAQQDRFWQEVVDGSGHVVLMARAGCGKSFSIIEAARRILAQQPDLRVGFSAFNRAIADELKPKVPAGAKAFTLHSLGYAAVRKAAGDGVVTVDEDGGKIANIVADLCDAWQWGAPDPHLLSVHRKLVGLCKGYLKDGAESDLDWIVARHDVEVAPTEKVMERLTAGDPPSGKTVAEWRNDIAADYRRRVYQLVPCVLARCKENLLLIDLDDQIWLPVVLGLAVEEFDLLLVDESQDMNPCQQRLAFMACPHGRIVVVGDNRQAIYAFRGADAHSMESMEAALKATVRGVVQLPLTQTRRCPRKVVSLARELVADFEAMPEAPEGEIADLDIAEVAAKARPGDMILCRTNAPLVGMAHELIRAGKKPVLRGKDISKRILALVKRMDADAERELPPAELTQKVSAYRATETYRFTLAGKAASIITNMQDDCDTVLTLLEGCQTRDHFAARVSAIFGARNTAGAITLSTVHGAKGLEADTVYILHPYLMPHPNATRPDDVEQEHNIKYVAITRAKRRLVWGVDEAMAAKMEWVREQKQPQLEASEAEDRTDLEPDVDALAEATIEGGPLPVLYSKSEPYEFTQEDCDAFDEAAWRDARREDARLATPTEAEPMGWRDEVRALLKKAHDRTPFDEDELCTAIELALAALNGTEVRS